MDTGYVIFQNIRIRIHIAHIVSRVQTGPTLGIGNQVATQGLKFYAANGAPKSIEVFMFYLCNPFVILVMRLGDSCVCFYADSPKFEPCNQCFFCSKFLIMVKLVKKLLRLELTTQGAIWKHLNPSNRLLRHDHLAKNYCGEGKYLL